jgi:hypothetical protein
LIDGNHAEDDRHLRGIRINDASYKWQRNIPERKDLA